MKPTVITNNGGGSAVPNHPGGGHKVNATTSPNNNSSNINPHQNDGNNNPNFSGTGSRQQFPHFQEFGFDPDMDDVFSDTGLRSRLGRIPFGFGSRKRCNDPNRYFDDDNNDFFSNFGSLGRRRQQPQATTERTGIFDHIPAEFRQYMPDTFDFPTMRNTPPSPRSAGVQQQQHPPQYYETYAQPGPGSPTATQPQPQKPKLCDAAIQTENLTDEVDEPNRPHKAQPLKHGLRNTVDLGQKSPPENEYSPRASSAPPNDASDQGYVSLSASTSTPNQNNAHTSATAYAYIPPPEHQRQPQQRRHSQQTNPQQKPQVPPHPPPRSQPQSQYYQATSQTQQPQPQSPTSAAFVRTVPIFVEGRSEPVINEQKHVQTESQPSHPSSQQGPQYQQPQQNQYQPHPQQPPHPQPNQQYQPYQQYQAQQQKPQGQARPTPLNTEQANAAPNQQSPVPSTPQTTATIEKIQLIQRDVLDLMLKVEKFGGMKNDKEYMYLDEMLTRNLLKLDTIDTQGKERIRLARKEAIKCIQASINVLEAKAEENAKTAQKSVMIAEENNANPQPQEITNNVNKNPESAPVIDEASTAKLPDVVPLPPPPERPINKKQQQLGKEENTETKSVAAKQEIHANQESKDEKIETVTEGSPKPDPNIVIPKEIEQKLNETTLNQVDKQKDESETPTESVSVAEIEDQQNKTEEKQSPPTKEERSKESPKKKIVKKIVKKIEKKEKKDKKGSATPPSAEQEVVSSGAEATEPSPVAEPST